MLERYQGRVAKGRWMRISYYEGILLTESPIHLDTLKDSFPRNSQMD